MCPVVAGWFCKTAGFLFFLLIKYLPWKSFACAGMAKKCTNGIPMSCGLDFQPCFSGSKGASLESNNRIKSLRRSDQEQWAFSGSKPRTWADRCTKYADLVHPEIER